MSWMAELLRRGRQRHGDRAAVIDGDRRVGYAELDRRTDALAAAFQAMGAGPGTRVAVLSRNRLEVLETYFALGKIGAAAVPVHYSAVPDEVRAVVRGCDTVAVAGESDLLARAGIGTDRPVLAFDSDAYERAVTGGGTVPATPVPDDELMFVLHTSATTGRPKGVCVDHRSLRSVALGYLADVRPEPGYVFMQCGPLSHGAMVLPLAYMAAGATVVLIRMFSPHECIAAIRRAEVTHLFVVPEMLRFVVGSAALPAEGLPSLREVIYAAAPMPRSLLLTARDRLGCDFRQVYGVTECGGPVATLAPAEHDYTPGEAHGPAASVGRPILGSLVRAQDDRDSAAPPHRAGELWVHGAAVMRGYWNDPDATAETMRDGWVRTGDLGTIDDNGYVYLAGRAKDVIIRGGQKVFPAEVEQVLMQHPAVREACVVGLPDGDWGEVPYAYVVADDDGTATLVPALRQIARDRLAGYKRPAGLEIVPDLPRNPAGKVTRRHLRDRAVAAGRGADPRP